MTDKIIRNILLIILLSFLSGCSFFEQKEDICIVYTNDTAGAVDGPIGFAGLKYFADRLKEEQRYVSVVDCGDFLEGDLAYASDGAHIITLMNAIPYDAAALGNQEFSLGIDALAQRQKQAAFPLLSCDLKYLGPGKDPLRKIRPYVIKRYGFTKVAFIGVTTPETILKEGKNAYEALMGDDGPLYSFYEGNEGADLYAQVQETIDKVRKRADYVVILAHLGSNSTIDGFSSYDLIANITGADVVLDGHSHTVISGEAVADKEGKTVVLSSTGKELENIGLLTIHADHTYTTALYPAVENKDPGIIELIGKLYSGE